MGLGNRDDGRRDEGGIDVVLVHAGTLTESLDEVQRSASAPSLPPWSDGSVRVVPWRRPGGERFGDESAGDFLLSAHRRRRARHRTGMLTPIAPDLFAVEGTMRLPGGVRFPLRMTIARLPSGGLWLHSPIEASDELVTAVSALGPVEHLVAPNSIHHLWIGDWKKRFPDARLYGGPGLAAKRRDLAFDGLLGQATPPWTDAFATVPIAGAPRIGETVFLHRPSSSLLVGDLLFNILRPRGIGMNLILAAAGTRDRLAVSRAWRLIRRDRQAFRSSLEAVVALPFRRLIPCHGAIVETDAHAATASALGVTAPAS